MEISPFGFSANPNEKKQKNETSTELDFSKILLQKTQQGITPNQIQHAAKAQQEGLNKNKFHIEDGAEMTDEETEEKLVKKIKKKIKTLLELERRFFGF
jgi:2-phosphoglycerate kinase